MSAAMSFAEAFAAMCAIAAERGESAMLAVEAWRHAHSDQSVELQIGWRIYSDADQDIYYGETPADALRRYRERTPEAGPSATSDATPETVAAIGRTS